MKQTKTHFVGENCSTSVPEEQVNVKSYNMFIARDKSSESIIVTCLLNGVPTYMELDICASLSIISQDTYSKIFKSSDIEMILKTLRKQRSS